MKKAIFIFGTILTLGLAACAPAEQGEGTTDAPQTEIGAGGAVVTDEAAPKTEEEAPAASDEAVETESSEEDNSEGGEEANQPKE